MQTRKQYQLTLENGERKTITDIQLKDSSRLFYTEIGPGFGMEAVVTITPLPNDALIENVQNAIQMFTDLELDYHFANEWDNPKEIDTFREKYRNALAALKALVNTYKID